MPKGFQEDGKVYKLKKSLYDLKQAPRNFFQHLKSNLEAIGFEQQIHIDPCLFISPTAICLVYVDDMLLYARSQQDIDKVIRKLQVDGSMTLEIEDITCDPVTKKVTLTQTDLIDGITLTQTLKS